MTRFCKFISAQRILAISIVLIAAVTASSAAFAIKKAVQSPPVAAHPEDVSPHEPKIQALQTATVCPKPLPMQGQHIFQDLKGVILDLEFSGRFLEAQACHGDDEKCYQLQPLARAPEYMKRLKEDYDSYPKALYPDRVAGAFRQAIEKQLRVTKPDQCHPSPISVLSFRPPEVLPSIQSGIIGKASFDDVNLPNTLTIRVRVDIDYDIVPQIAVLSINLFRPDSVSSSTFLNTLPFITLIPLNLKQEEIDKQFNDFVRHAELQFTAGIAGPPIQY